MQNSGSMKPWFEQWAAYNVWANHKIVFAIQNMPAQSWMQQTPSSFDSLYKTVLHLWDAESIWWQRIRMHETIIVPSTSFDPSMQDACKGLMHQSMQWEKFIKEELTEDALHSNLLYSTSRGENFAQPVHEILLHLFNHSTYHRGQLITMMRALGETQLPQTDYIQFSRRRH